MVVAERTQCPRCDGDFVPITDQYGPYRTCISCGYHEYDVTPEETAVADHHYKRVGAAGLADTHQDAKHSIRGRR